MKKVIALLIIAVSSFMCSCWNVAADIEITKQGLTRLKITHETVFCGEPIQNTRHNMIREGFQNIKMWENNRVCYLTGEKWGDIRKDFKLVEFMSVHVEGEKSTGLFKNKYKFLSYVGQYDPEVAKDQGLSRAILQSMKLIYRIKLPGKIINTTGKIAKDGNTSVFVYDFYTLSTGKRKIYVESELGGFKDWFSARNKADLIIEDREQELYEIQSKLSDLDYKISWEYRFQKDKDQYVKSADRQVVNLMNEFVKQFKKNKNENPKSLIEIKEFLESKDIEFENLPQPINSKIVYNNEKSRFELDEIKGKEGEKSI